MITVDIGNNGRLGNQMFQYASLIGIATKQGFDYCIDYTKGNNIQWNEFSDDECLNKNFLTIDKAFNLSAKQSNGNFDKEIREFSDEFHFQERFFNTGDNVKLHGYFQSEKYFKHCESIIRKEFEFKNSIFNAANLYLKDKCNNETVSIHVRRGDYIQLPHHGICELNYYVNALQSHFNNKQYNFIILTDDIKWAKTTFSGGNNFFISETQSQFVDLCIMSLCNHNIIANSSFSWWGSWLNKNPNKKIIAPKTWFKLQLSKLDTKDLYCNNWIIV